MYSIDHTHDEKLTSWVESANEPANWFPIQNLPFCCFVPAGVMGPSRLASRIGVGIGDQVIDLRQLAEAGLLPGELELTAAGPDMGQLMNISLDLRRLLRHRLSELLSESRSALAARSDLRKSALFSQTEVNFLMPCRIGNYTDFYANLYHATNVGSMFRPDNPLLPNYKFLPIGYHGRASSVVVSGHKIKRPIGQLSPSAEGESPTFSPCKMLDYELEVGVYVGTGNELGRRIPLADAESHLFGLTIVNDWSARDIQRWEYQPLGPFLAKSFATTVSPWITTMEALAPFRGPAMKRPANDPQPLDYLLDSGNQSTGGMDLTLTVKLGTRQMIEQQQDPQTLTQCNFLQMYWTFAQMVAHHTSNGCNLQTGDLLASGTVSGPEKHSRGCLLELTWNGEYGKPAAGSDRTPIEFPTGETRTFLNDGDRVVMTGYCQRPGYRSIGLGTCEGDIDAAMESSP